MLSSGSVEGGWRDVVWTVIGVLVMVLPAVVIGKQFKHR
jgi:hypothetical protein